LTVADVERSAKFFRDVFGVDVTVDRSSRTDSRQMELFGVQGAQYREAAVHWPVGTPQLYLRQFGGIERKTFNPAVSDPNATLIRIRLRDTPISAADMASFLAKVKAFPDAKIVNVSGGPTGPALRFDGVPWLIVQVPGSTTYLQIVGGPGG
jgi:catechol 2,3-dioxygenase-like lactoylglutathione lyase family enzyme